MLDNALGIPSSQEPDNDCILSFLNHISHSPAPPERADFRSAVQWRSSLCLRGGRRGCHTKTISKHPSCETGRPGQGGWRRNNGGEGARRRNVPDGGEEPKPEPEPSEPEHFDCSCSGILFGEGIEAGTFTKTKRLLFLKRNRLSESSERIMNYT